MTGLVHQLGFALLGGVFVWAAAEHVLRFRAIAAVMAGRGLRPAGALLAAGSALEGAAGLALALGLARPWAALALIGFTVAASLMLLDFWRFEGAERQTARSAFLLNVAVVGGLILASLDQSA